MNGIALVGKRFGVDFIVAYFQRRQRILHSTNNNCAARIQFLWERLSFIHFDPFIRRDDVAQLSVEALMNPAASGLTFEVKSDLPFSQVWKGPSEGDPARDYG